MPGTWEALLVAGVIIAIAMFAVARSKRAERRALALIKKELGLVQLNEPELDRPMLRGEVDGVSVDIQWTPPPGKKRGTVTRVILELPDASNKRLLAIRRQAKKKLRLPVLSTVDVWSKGLMVTVNANVGPGWEAEKLVKAVRRLIAMARES